MIQIFFLLFRLIGKVRVKLNNVSVQTFSLCLQSLQSCLNNICLFSTKLDHSNSHCLYLYFSGSVFNFAYSCRAALISDSSPLFPRTTLSKDSLSSFFSFSYFSARALC